MDKSERTPITVEHLVTALQQIMMHCGAVLAALDSLDPTQRRDLRFALPREPGIPVPDDVFCPKLVLCPKPIAVKCECWMPAPPDWVDRLESPRPKARRKTTKPTPKSRSASGRKAE